MTSGRRGRLPLLLMGGLVAAVMAGSVVYPLVRRALPASGMAAQPVAGIRCDRSEQRAAHFHVHLDVFDAGRPVTVPANIGIPAGRQCLYWIHTHDTTGVIHIEAPAGEQRRTFTLGDFLAIWGKGPIVTTGVPGVTVSGDRFPVVIVDGRRFTEDPDGIVLAAHRRITIEVAPPLVPQPGFTFRKGL